MVRRGGCGSKKEDAKPPLMPQTGWPGGVMARLLAGNAAFCYFGVEVRSTLLDGHRYAGVVKNCHP
jgi:hypothetical protein